MRGLAGQRAHGYPENGFIDGFKFGARTAMYSQVRAFLTSDQVRADKAVRAPVSAFLEPALVRISTLLRAHSTLE